MSRRLAAGGRYMGSAPRGRGPCAPAGEQRDRPAHDGEVEEQRAPLQIVEIEGELGMELMVHVVAVRIGHLVELDRLIGREVDLAGTRETRTHREQRALLA